MSSSTNSNLKFAAYTVITLAGMSFVAAGFVIPQAIDYARTASIHYAATAIGEEGSEAAIDYRLAYALDDTPEERFRFATRPPEF